MNTTAATPTNVSGPCSTPEQFSVPRLVALHLLPGALVTVGFAALAPVIEAAGLPPIAALLAVIVVVLIPVELGIVFLAARRNGFDATVPYRRRLRGRDWFWLVPALILAAFAGFGVHMVIEPRLIERLFAGCQSGSLRPFRSAMSTTTPPEHGR